MVPLNLTSLPLWLTVVTAQAVLCLFTIFILLKIVYRLLWHPLASIPGPKRAAASTLYRMYYDIHLDGEWAYHLKNLHDKYGQHIRICGLSVLLRLPKLRNRLL